MEAAASADCIVAAAAAKDAAAAAAYAKEAAVAASAAALNAKEAAVTASAAASDAKEAAALAAAAVAAMQASRKRKFHLISGGQDPPGSAIADDGESLDFISRLPDAVLGSIVSLLPTKEGARTQALSRRWRPLWHSAPLNLVADSELRSNGHATIDLIPKILSQHPGPARRFSFSLSIDDFSDKIEGWLSSQALDNLQELELTYCILEKNLLPMSVFRFAPTLRVAKFSRLHFPDLIMQLSLKFPCLKHLNMQYVTISEDALESMLSGCAALESLELEDIVGRVGHFCISSQTLKFPFLKKLTLKGVTISQDALQSIFSSCHALESLELSENSGIRCLCIRSQTLKSLVFCFGWCNLGFDLKELIIEDAPCLDRLVQLYPSYKEATVRVISAPKLKILGILSVYIPELHLGTTVFQKMIAVGLITKIHTMRVLVLYSVGPNLDAVVNFLKCFPCLERLYVVFQPVKSMDNARKYDPLDPVECLELHLKEVVLKNYDGAMRSSIDFAKFFLLNAKVLKEMKITLPYHRQHKWFVKQHKVLRIKNRASRDARTALKCGTHNDYTLDGHIHDFSMADPFDMPSRRCSECCCGLL